MEEGLENEMSEFTFESWPTEFRSINQYFGANPQSYAQFGLPGHEGLDIMAPTGSKILAVAKGTVRMVRTNPVGHNYGIHVRVDHGDGYQTIYAHLQEARINQGESVQAGGLLGLADNTGNSFGSHLHLTLKKKGVQQGNWPAGIIDPTPFLLPLMGWRQPAGPYIEGWVYTAGIFVVGDLAQASAGGVNLRAEPNVRARLLDLVPAGTILLITGTSRGQYTPVRVSAATLEHAKPASPPPPTSPPPAGNDTVEGWGWASYLTGTGDRAVVGQFGINLRVEPHRNSVNIGLVRGGVTVAITGSPQGEYLPVRVSRADFSGPVNLPDAVQERASGEKAPPLKDSLLGWAFTQNLTFAGSQAVSGKYGTNLRNRPSRSAQQIGLFKEGATAIVAGLEKGEYTPLLVKRSDISDVPASMPSVEQPEPLPGGDAAPPPPLPIHDTTPGWAFTGQISIAGGMATAGQFGINLRDAPRRNARNIGFVPARASMIVTGTAQGEYTPVRVNDVVLQESFKPTLVTDTRIAPEAVDPEPQPLGQARIGLHASADPIITDQEVAEFKAMRPGIIKLLSFHDPEGITKLVAQHPEARWIVRTVVNFDGREIGPEQFVKDTIDDTRRTLNLLKGKDVVIELHNEPNLVREGLGSSWDDGVQFAAWWMELIKLYRNRLPGQRFIFPGLSPGSAIRGIKQDHVQFLEASRAAIDAADGLAIHLHWSQIAPMPQALNVLDDYISRFRFTPMWVTKAGNNRAGAPSMKGQQYLRFWKELQKRPTVQGVTFFVASASNPDFAEEVWVGRGIGEVVGRR
jgi:hypothetical protein